MPPRAPVDAPQPQVARTGLLGAAGTIDDPLTRWQYGITYDPRRYTSGGTFDPRNCDPQELPGTPGPGIVEWDAYGIWWAEVCAVARPAALDELRQGAVNSLDVQRSHFIEQVLWTNKVNGVDINPPNVGLASPVVDSGATVLGGGAALGVTSAWSALLTGLAGCLGGARGMIHVPVGALPFLDFYGLVVREGTRLLAASADHLVVAGSGYSGTGPGDLSAGTGDVWFYATTPVQVRVGPIESRAEWDQLDRATNELVVRAFMPALASWDRQCHLAVQVCLEDPGPICEGS